MAQAVTFPDIEATLVAHLSTALGVPVTTRVPEPRPAQFVRLLRVGGPRRDLVTDGPMVVFECWAQRPHEAASLGETTRAHVSAMDGTDVGGVWVRQVQEVGGLQNYPDPLTGDPRYQFTAMVDVAFSGVL